MSAVYNSGGGGPSCDANGMVEFHTLGQPGQYGSASGPGGFLSAAPHQLISHHSHHPQQMVSALVFFIITFSAKIVNI